MRIIEFDRYRYQYRYRYQVSQSLFLTDTDFNLNFYFLPIPIPVILADISRYLPILANISANFTDTDIDIEYFQRTDIPGSIPIPIPGISNGIGISVYRYIGSYRVSVEL